MRQKIARTVVFLVIVAGAGLRCNPHSESQLVIGAVLPLTGSAAVWGVNARRGIELALTELNAKRTPRQRLTVIYEDSRSDSQSAVSALRKLIAADHVPAVVGDIASSSVLAMAPVAESSSVVLLSPGASNPKISDAGEFIFRNWQSDALEGRVDAEFAWADRHWRRVATLYVSNAYGTGLNEEFTRAYKALGGTVVAEESFDQGATDLRAQITRLRQQNFDALYMPGYPPEMALALKEMAELHLTAAVLSVQAFDDPEIIARAGVAANGVTFSVPRPPDNADPIVASFRKNYRARYHVDPGVCSDTGYDAIRLMAAAVDHGARTGDQIRAYLVGVKDFPGAAGPTTFDKHGDVARPFEFKQIVKGHAVVVSGATR
jgi:branched-chain amino acid transport system substrate-binding protein